MTNLIPGFSVRMFLVAAGLAAGFVTAGTSPARLDAAEKNAPSFYRGINLNGPPLEIDGRKWEGSEGAADFAAVGRKFENQSVPLKPSTDAARATMIRSSLWGNTTKLTLTSVPSGKYSLFLYVWEDNDAQQFRIALNGRTVLERYDSRGAGIWQKLGPWVVDAADGTIRLETNGGHANLSGLEVWKGEVRAADTLAAAFPKEQIEFFESKIRPILVNRCYECHSTQAKEPGGGLRLDSRPGLLTGGDSGPAIVPGDAAASLLYSAVSYKSDDLQMPPKGKLPDEEIAQLERWIKLGAPDPRTQAAPPLAKIDIAKAREFWSLRPLTDPRPPAVKDTAWPLSDLDRFILARLEEKNLRPAPPADPRTLIRRITYDLTGLPPTPEEIDDFLRSARHTPHSALEALVDRLLASPAYGERWGRHWLDVVRYADTAGDNSDYPIPQMYKYRNWVIDALNADMPYDQFVREQLAGDLLPAESEEERYRKIIATGYLANSKRFGSYEDARYPWHLTIEDTIDNLGRTFLGMTINCCRCHDHKFDPFTNEDYYALYGFFQSTRYPWPGIELDKAQRDLVPLAPPEAIAAGEKERKAKLAEFDQKIKQLEDDQKQANEGLKQAEQLADEAERKDRIAALTKELDRLKKAVKDARSAREAFIRQPLPYELAYAVAEGKNEGKKKVGNACIQIKGDPERQGPEVPRRFPTVLGGQELPEGVTGSGRLELANWIVDPQNPLTARVMVNRIWHYHFGRGIVPTPSDFGKQGLPPTHPELLDWLARRFIDSGWSLKSMHKLMVLSRTYQMSSRDDAANQQVDPSNDFYWQFNRQRLDAESIRDTLLAVSGKLERGPGGPHPFPEQTKWDFTQHKPFKAVYESNRRSVYLMTQRFARHPYLALFDGADTNASTARRITTTTPLQALYLMNDPFVHEQARHFAARLLRERTTDADRLDLCYLRLFARPATDDERATALDYLSRISARLGPAANGDDPAPPPVADADTHRTQKSWESLVRALWMSNEFVYVE